MFGRMTRTGRAGTPLAAMVAGALAWSGCEPAPTEVTVAQPAPTTMVATPVEPVALEVSDVAGLAVSATNATIQRSEVARVRAADPRVRAFAGRAVSQSQAASRVMQQQFAIRGITPRMEATAQQVDRYAAETVSVLQTAQGYEVDRIYLESQIAHDRWLIGMLDTVIPTVPGEVRDGLVDLRGAVNARITEAQSLEAMVLSEHAARIRPVDRQDRTKRVYR